MDVPPPRRSQRIPPPKPRLNPPCAVFPDVVHLPSVPTLPPRAAPAPQTPPRVGDDPFDYFRWRAFESAACEEAYSSVPDLSTCAPCGALPDLHCATAGIHAPRAQCYAACHGLQSPMAARVVAGGVMATLSTKRRSRRAVQHVCTCHVPLHAAPVGGAFCPAHRAYGAWGGDELDGSSDCDSLLSDDELEHESMHDGRCRCRASGQCGWCAAASTLRRKPEVVSFPLSDFSPYGINSGDITAEQAAQGVDVQGIPWDTLQFTRDDYRATRLRENPRRDSSESADGLVNARFYDFFKNTRKVKCNIVHFQLRNLAWATSKHDVFVMHQGVIVHWDSCAKRKSKVLDLSGSTTSGPNSLGMLVQISTLIAKDDLVIAGGFFGEMIAKNLKTGTIIHNQRITYDDNAITNAIDIYDGTIITSNNDCFVRTFDKNTFQRKSAFRFQKPVNHATRRPFGKMIAVAGDDKPIQVIDGDSGERITQLYGHEDFSFATAWHPSGRLLATGSQDQTCRVWDVRNMSQSISVLGARLGAVRSLRFSPCGQFMFMAEARDYVHIFDVNRGEFDTCQEIDLFGEIAGIALTPCSEGLYIAVSDRTYSSLLEYERRSTSLVSDLLL